ncbi:SigE family RNA polymerase sigma factor [Goodfellowiella coeruleoviolacea]|uniref:RNA polymerase sigma-70 factor, sigma-E family n=1 Tax=Goodfellowiella coeruleoviolacea TaxID=334858 RepID=A0AAE3KIH9_9PSEU|nr:SigE family RNA polymerase sigma factor [Goodfellowiella coeruleoviolacea]MCP2169281.1 RNA polymerase sigma-70 factor, sigma-E family [Goodfellowiella coeruleoviolacea]
MRHDEFEQFVRDRYGQLLRYAVMLAGHQADAEEVVQESLLRCLGRWRRMKPDNALAYARKAVLHEFLRSTRPRAGLTASARAKSAELTEEVTGDFTSEIAERDRILTVLQRLPPRQRAAVVMRFLLDLSEAQTSREMKCSVGTVKSLTSRGLARIREIWAVQPVLDAASTRRERS